MSGEVGVLLDELPLAMRDAVAASIIAEPASFWIERAERQLELSDDYRFYYPKRIPLAPPAAWKITLEPGAAERRTRDGHDLVSVFYGFEAVLFSDTDTPTELDPPLALPGDEHDEQLVLPIDPDLLYERIADQCLDGGNNLLPYFYCPGAVKSIVGLRDAWRHHRRLTWDPARAELARVGVSTNPDGADLEALASGLEHNIIRYRYVASDSCEVGEGCVTGSGWRRLLEFDSRVVNHGAKPLHIGPVFGSAWEQRNVFSFSPCHGHMHFLFYGEYHLGVQAGDKRAFCLISTSRLHNDEHTPLFTPYDNTCVFQGIAAGWGDDYFIGLDCQWIDITDVALGSGTTPMPLEFRSNPEHFLCEGKPVLDPNGEPMFEPTPFVNDSGAPIDRPMCELFDGWDANNVATATVGVPDTGSLYTQPCSRLFVGSRRGCGFTVSQDDVACSAGQPVTLSCSIVDPSAPQVVRICEHSQVLGAAMECSYFGALGSAVLDTPSTQLVFTCPTARDAAEPGGAFSIMTAPLVSGGTTQTVSCTVQ